MDDRQSLTYAQLKLHHDIPNLEDTWLDGYEKGLHDIPEADNPYKAGIPEYYQWIEGWWSGFYEEKPLFPVSEENDEKAFKVNKSSHFKFSLVNSRMVMRFLQLLSAVLTMILCYQLVDAVA